MTWILEPRGTDQGHVLVNRTGAAAYGVTATALDDAADAWHAARPPYSPNPHARLGLSGDTEVAEGDDVGGWRFTLDPNEGGVLEVRWSDFRGGPLAHVALIDPSRSLESVPANG